MPAPARLTRRLPAARARDAVLAGAAASVLSGVPSTVHALTTGRSVLDGAAAAGTILLRDEHRTPVLVAAAVPVHLALSFGWAQVIAVVVPRRRPVAGAIACALAIAALDLEVIGRRLPRIRALPQTPQWLDHVASRMGRRSAGCYERVGRRVTWLGERAARHGSADDASALRALSADLRCPRLPPAEELLLTGLDDESKMSADLWLGFALAGACVAELLVSHGWTSADGGLEVIDVAGQARRALDLLAPRAAHKAR